VVVGGDPYELRIFAPITGGPQHVKAASVSRADKKAGVTIQAKQTGAEIRVTIASSRNRRVSWEVAFKHR
jgi:hypothetical protein